MKVVIEQFWVRTQQFHAFAKDTLADGRIIEFLLLQTGNIDLQSLQALGDNIAGVPIVDIVLRVNELGPKLLIELLLTILLYALFSVLGLWKVYNFQQLLELGQYMLVHHCRVKVELFLLELFVDLVDYYSLA